MKHVVKCLTFNREGKILLIKRADNDSHGGSWETPGGGVDGLETLDEACIREVKEETSLTIESPNFQQTIVMEDSETSELFNVHLFVVITTKDEDVLLQTNPDHSEFAWVEPLDVLHYNIDTWTDKQIEIYINR